MRGRALPLLLVVLLLLPYIALAAPFDAGAGLAKAGDALFGQNINLGNAGGLKDNGLLRGALALGLGVNIDPVTGAVTMSVFDLILTATLVLPMAGLAVRGLAMGGKALAMAAGRLAAKQIAKEGAERLAPKIAIGIAENVGRFGSKIYKGLTVIKDGIRVARTQFTLINKAFTGVKNTLKGFKASFDLGHASAWLKSTPRIIDKAKNIVNLFPHINVVASSSVKGIGIVATKLHISTAPLVWAGRSVASSVSSFVNKSVTPAISSFSSSVSKAASSLSSSISSGLSSLGSSLSKGLSSLTSPAKSAPAPAKPAPAPSKSTPSSSSSGSKGGGKK